MLNQIKLCSRYSRNLRHAAAVYPPHPIRLHSFSSIVQRLKQPTTSRKLYSTGLDSSRVNSAINLSPTEPEQNPSTLNDEQAEDWMEIGEVDVEEDIYDEFQGVSLKRGITGVFDIEEFTELLRREHLTDIAVIAIPPELQFVDYMVISTGKSPKQMAAVAGFIRRVFKRRALQSDQLPVIEGKDNKDWIAMDLGNIALHIFARKTRDTYDLETLWTCGAKYDDLSQEPEDPFAALTMEFTSQTASH